MGNSKIEWTEKTWNPVTGCTKISPGCQNCYAERMAKRLAGRAGYPKYKPFAVTIHKDRLEEPLRWRKPSRIFVCSMGDLFHQDVPIQFIVDVFSVIAECHHHTFIILTKRPDNLKRFFSIPTIANDIWLQTSRGVTAEKSPWPLPNVWIGVTAENQEMADERIPVLLQIPAAVRFVSVEPMLGPVSFRWLSAWPENAPTTAMNPYNGGKTNEYDGLRRLDWVICGGESGGPVARPVRPDWVRSLRDQCQAAGVPFFFKQWGEWCYPEQMTQDTYREVDMAHNLAGHGDYNKPWFVGKKNAGRLLDGREWNEYPEVNK